MHVIYLQLDSSSSAGSFLTFLVLQARHAASDLDSIWILARSDIVRQTYDVVLNIAGTYKIVRTMLRTTLNIRYRTFQVVNIIGVTYDIVG